MISGLTPALERILEAGNRAPSGENSQPWHFSVRGNTIDVHLVPERNESAYGWGHRASYFACGAAIENIVIAASHEKMHVTVEVLPHNDDPLLVARVSLVPDAAAKFDPLAEVIATRSTNRKAYSTDPLTPSQREALLGLGSAAAMPVLVEKREDIKRLARVGSTNEEIMLANHGLHQFFFSHVNWTKDEDEARKIGFFIDTLELPPPARLMFKIFRHWSVMRVFIRAGMHRFVAVQNAATNGAASAIGGIIIAGPSPQEFVDAGRLAERLWLTAATEGLMLQPLTGILFFKLAITAGEDSFSAKEREHISRAYAEAEEILGAKNKHVAFMFRIGKGEAPTARASRFPLEQMVTVT